jgi:hypothetical protein
MLIPMNPQANLDEVLYSKNDKDLPSGKSFEEWATRWWQWLYSIPDGNSPLHDRNWNISGSNQNQTNQTAGNQVEDMSLSIVNKKEGKKYELGTSDLKAYDVKTGPFKVDLPSDNICYWVPEKKGSTAVSHGFWAFLRPMPKGEYDIKFSQRTKDDPQTLTKNCSYEVEYHIEVR